MTTDLSRALMQIARSVDPSSEEDARRLAEREVKQFKNADLRELAIRELDNCIMHYRRERARQVERDAAQASESVRAAQQKRSNESSAKGMYESFFADPAGGYVRSGRGLTRYYECISNARERKAFRRWLGERFEEWYARAEQVIATGGSAEDLDWFRADWHPDGINAYYRDQRVAATARLIQQVAEETRIEVTTELLATYFALGDGESVTWGDATVDQHEQRIELLTRNAAGVVEAAARHHAAIQMIRSAGVEKLAEVGALEDAAA